ncbi:MAG: hypothetical protein ABIA93_04560 [Candidatus Woesearchaeota archaeon]
MNIIIFIVGVLVAYLGMLVGVGVSHYTRRELKVGRPYFVGLQRALVVMFLLVPLLFSLEYGIVLLIALLLLAAFLIKAIDHLAYVLFAILLPYSSVNVVFFCTMVYLAFLFGIPSGSLYAEKRKIGLKANILNAARKYAYFPILTIVVGILFSAISFAP